ncbi:hypothetical protein Pcinc_020263 [Petrolisthes cinctipes]|uniref:Uncharacterized protein n=1 Tax=Petrolisthes cinctipes TaxID=88211 RepID=A0AAE1FJI2_PETCI|nr:hypothetical protein Pcinc_020263 [Petrolisthes cinctipes]
MVLRLQSAWPSLHQPHPALPSLHLPNLAFHSHPPLAFSTLSFSLYTNQTYYLHPSISISSIRSMCFTHNCLSLPYPRCLPTHDILTTLPPTHHIPHHTLKPPHPPHQRPSPPTLHTPIYYGHIITPP